MAKHNELGRDGESRAVAFLQENGYSVLETNWRFGKAEIDILASKGELLVAVEVKARSAITFGLPQDFVNPKKIKLLVGAVSHWCETHSWDGNVRFDIIALVREGDQWQLEHIEDAFYIF